MARASTAEEISRPPLPEAASVARPVAASPARAVWGVFLLTLAVYIFTASGHFQIPDNEYYYRMARAILLERSFAVEPYDERHAARGLDGRTYALYAPGLPLALTPLVLLGRALAEPLSAVEPLYSWSHQDPADLAGRLVVSYFNAPIVAASAALLVLLVWRLGYSTWAALAVGLIYGLATPAWAQARSVFAEPLQGLLLLLAVLLLFRARPAQALLGGLVLALATLVNATSLMAVPGLLFLPDSRSRPLWGRPAARLVILAPVLVAVALLCLYNQARFGGPFNAGPPSGDGDGSGLAGNPLVGLYGLFFSIGRGILWYAPPLIAALTAYPRFRRAQPAVSLALSIVVVLWILLHSGWNDWHGGWGWGPRYLVPMLPFMLLPLAAAWEWRAAKRFVLGLAVLGALIQIPGATVDFFEYSQSLVRDCSSPSCTYTSSSQFFNPAWSDIYGHLRYLKRGRVDLAWLSFAGTWLSALTVVLVLLLLALAVWLLWPLLRSAGQARKNRQPSRASELMPRVRAIVPVGEANGGGLLPDFAPADSRAAAPPASSSFPQFSGEESFPLPGRQLGEGEPLASGATELPKLAAEEAGRKNGATSLDRSLAARLTGGVFFVALAFYLLTANGHLQGPDHEYYYQMARGLLFRGSLAVDRLPGRGEGTTGVDGRFYAQYPPGLPLVLVPWLALSNGLANSLIPIADNYVWPNAAPADAATRFVVSYFNAPITAATAALLALLVLRLGYSVGAALFVGLTFALATPAWSQARSLFAEPLQGLLLLLAFLLLLRATVGRLLLAGGVLGAALLVKLTSGLVLPGLLLLPAAGGRQLWRQRVVLFLAAPFVLGIVLYGLYNLARFGNPLATGYLESFGRSPFGDPLAGLYGLLFSAGRGVFWYAPPVLVGLIALRRFWAQQRPIMPSLLIMTVAWLALHSLWRGWHGGEGWGPRFLVPILPLWLLPIAACWDAQPLRRLALVVTALGVLVQIPGVLVDFMAWGREVEVACRDTSCHNILSYLVFEPTGSDLYGHLKLLQSGKLDLAWLTFKVAWIGPVTQMLVAASAALGIALLRQAFSSARA